MRPIRLGVFVLVGAGLILGGCGRKGPPEYDSGEPIAKPDTSRQVPGLPQKSATPPKPVPPKGNFILDPLL